MTEYAELAYVDDDETGLQVGLFEDGVAIVQTVRNDSSTEALLDRGKVLDLYHRLGDHLVRTADESGCQADNCCTDLPDATADGYDWTAPATVPQDTVLDQAKAAVYGDRQADYGHPREDFTRQAILWTGLLQHKLADGQYIEAEDIARCMVAVKLARDVHSPKRDNRVDGAGYFLTLDRLATGQ